MPSVLLCVSPCHSLVSPTLSLSLSVRLYLYFLFLAFIPFHSVIPGKVFMISLSVLLLFVILTRLHKHSHTLPAQQQDSCLSLFTANSGDHPLFYTAITPSVRGGRAAICSQASSHNAQQYTGGYESQVILPTLLI